MHIYTHAYTHIRAGYTHTYVGYTHTYVYIYTHTYTYAYTHIISAEKCDCHVHDKWSFLHRRRRSL